MQEILDKVEGAVTDEYAVRCLAHGMFNSPHEGYAVLLEEIEEAIEGIGPLTENFGIYWENVRGNAASKGPQACLVDIERVAIHTAAELIQVAAMCRKNKLLYAQDQIYKED